MNPLSQHLSRAFDQMNESNRDGAPITSGRCTQVVQMKTSSVFFHVWSGIGGRVIGLETLVKRSRNGMLDPKTPHTDGLCPRVPVAAVCRARLARNGS